LGPIAREKFIAMAEPVSLSKANKPADYANLALAAAQGESPGSSAGGEQPKFCTLSPAGHVLVKFTVAKASPVCKRWRDLLVAEHLALETLHGAGVAAAQSRLLDVGTQRFLELVRFDREGLHGRRALLSLAALDGEFVGKAAAPWPVITAQLARLGVITPEAHARTAFVYAFGTLIGNTDMHAGNLSFVGDSGRPYDLSPAYDMLPMAFSPSSGGVLRDSVSAANLHSAVDAATWRSALALARDYVARLSKNKQLSPSFKPCVRALHEMQLEAEKKMAKLG
jgi:serine/threonine protein kinase HipA of HipAB toxin-antitoxin module